MLKEMVFALMVLLAMSPVMAGDISECAKIADQDKKNACLAGYAGSATYCEKIKNGELKRSCMFKVIRIQRDVAYKSPKPKPAPPAEE